MNAPTLKDEAPGAVRGAEGLAENTKSTTIVSRADIERKQFETCRAIAALAGITLYKAERDDGTTAFIAAKHGLTRELHTLDDVIEWLDRVVPQ